MSLSPELKPTDSDLKIVVLNMCELTVTEHVSVAGRSVNACRIRSAFILTLTRSAGCCHPTVYWGNSGLETFNDPQANSLWLVKLKCKPASPPRDHVSDLFTTSRFLRCLVPTVSRGPGAPAHSALPLESVFCLSKYQISALAAAASPSLWTDPFSRSSAPRLGPSLLLSTRSHPAKPKPLTPPFAKNLCLRRKHRMHEKLDTGSRGPGRKSSR